MAKMYIRNPALGPKVIYRLELKTPTEENDWNLIVLFSIWKDNRTMDLAFYDSRELVTHTGSLYEPHLMEVSKHLKIDAQEYCQLVSQAVMDQGSVKEFIYSLSKNKMALTIYKRQYRKMEKFKLIVISLSAHEIEPDELPLQKITIDEDDGSEEESSHNEKVDRSAALLHPNPQFNAFNTQLRKIKTNMKRNMRLFNDLNKELTRNIAKLNHLESLQCPDILGHVQPEISVMEFTSEVTLQHITDIIADNKLMLACLDNFKSLFAAHDR